MIKIGDRVKFVSDTGVGRVTKIEGESVYVDVEDGFEIPVLMSDVVVVNEEDELDALSRIGASDEKPGRRNRPARKPEEKKKAPAREPAYKKYGRIALADDYADEEEADEDEDFVLDVHEMKEKYLRNLALRRERENEMNAARSAHEQEKARTQEEAPADEAYARELAQKDRPAPKPKKEEKQPEEPETVDLHAEEILASTEGLSAGQILTAQMARFTFTLDTLAKSKKHGKIVFIHGVGKGRLKYEMLKTLKQDYPRMDYQDASFKEYGYGAIIVYY